MKAKWVIYLTLAAGAQQQWCAARFKTPRRIYAVNSYTADVPSVDVDLTLIFVQNLSLLGSLHEAAEGADFPNLDSDLVGVAGVYNLFILTEIPVMCTTCAGLAALGVIPGQKTTRFMHIDFYKKIYTRRMRTSKSYVIIIIIIIVTNLLEQHSTCAQQRLTKITKNEATKNTSVKYRRLIGGIILIPSVV